MACKIKLQAKSFKQLVTPLSQSPQLAAGAGIVTDLNYYFRRNKAVEYRDIKLYALQDSKYPDSIVVGWTSIPHRVAHFKELLALALSLG
jgi:hypothetical protein